MGKALRIVIPNPSLVISSAARNLSILLRAGSVRNLVLSGKDCLVASLLAMTFRKELLNLDIIENLLYYGRGTIWVKHR